ncbi:hypothetical protein [Marinilabilia salmonicolor]|nr:hypothetical protein [Marinilabilia salmonicolor]
MIVYNYDLCIQQTMNTIAFIDIETDVRTGKILDVGYVDGKR